MVANYIITHRMHPHTPLIWYNWRGLGYCYIIHLLSCCRVLTITFQSGEPPPSALRYALPCPALNRTVHSAAATATSCCHVCWKMRPVKCWLWSRFSDCCWCQRIQPYVSGAHKTDAGAAACLTHITAGSSFCSQPDRLHQLYKRCFCLFIYFLKGGGKKYFHFETTQRCFGFETNSFARGFLLKTFMRLPDCGAHAERGRDSTCSELMQTISKLGNFECTWATSPHS